MIGRKGLVSLSNMPEIEDGKGGVEWKGQGVKVDGQDFRLGEGFEKEEGDWVLNRFEKTPLVSVFSTFPDFGRERKVFNRHRLT